MPEDASVSRVAVIGVGRMGLPVVANLVRAGYQVRAFDERAEPKAHALALGAHWAKSLPSAIAGAEVVLTALPGSPELRSVMLGDGSAAPGLLDRLPAGCTWLDLTSASPELGDALSRAARARGIGYLDTAVGGGVHAAQQGSLTLYVGGDHELLERHRSLLTAIADADRIHYMGGSGSGYLTKLLVNLLWFGQAVATGEALLLGQRAGLDPSLLRDVFARSAASSEFVRSYLPSLLDGDYLTTFGLDRCVEELDSIERFARHQATPFELSSSVAQVHRDALAHFGSVDGELMAVAYLEHQAGARLQRV